MVGEDAYERGAGSIKLIWHDLGLPWVVCFILVNRGDIVPDRGGCMEESLDEDLIEELTDEVENIMKNEALIAAVHELLAFYDHAANIPQMECENLVEEDGRGRMWESVIITAVFLERGDGFVQH